MPASLKHKEFDAPKVSGCFQCLKCTNGCPATFAMDIMPHQIIHLLQLGQLDKALKSKTIWVCASCETCSTRCPNNVNVAHVMDILRQMAREKGLTPESKSTLLFHAEFLNSIKNFSRLNEISMMANYTRKSQGLGALMKQSALGLTMLRKGKLKLRPHALRGNKEVKNIFKQTEKKK